MVHQIDITDEFHVDPPSVGGFKRQVFIADVFLPLQFRKVGLVGSDILENAQFPDSLAQELFARVSQQLDQKRIHVVDRPGLGIKDQDAVLGRFKQAAIANLRSNQCLFRPLAVGDVARNMDAADEISGRIPQRGDAQEVVSC